MPSISSIAKCQIGLSAIELIVVMAFTAMIFVYAATSSNEVASDADLYMARDLVEDSVRIARKNARIRESEVFLVFEATPGESQFQIDIQSASKAQYLEIFDKLVLPRGIVISSLEKSFRFDRMGQVESPATITLAQLGPSSQSIDIQIN